MMPLSKTVLVGYSENVHELSGSTQPCGKSGTIGAPTHETITMVPKVFLELWSKLQRGSTS